MAANGGSWIITVRRRSIVGSMCSDTRGNMLVYSIYIYIYVCVYVYHYYYHHIMLSGRRTLILSCHQSLSFVAPGRSSRQHLVSAPSWCIKIFAGRTILMGPYLRVHRRTSIEFVLASPAVPRVSCSTYLGGFLTWEVCVQLLFCGVQLLYSHIHIQIYVEHNQT